MDTKLPKPENNRSGIFSSTLGAADVEATLSTPLPTVAPGVIVAEPGTAKEEHIFYAEVDSGTNKISGLIRDITNLNGGTGYEHLANAEWEVLQSSEYVTNIIDVLQQGFQKEMQSIARTGDTTFTVDGNVTAYYTKGRVIRVNSDSTKIAIVNTSSYNGGTGLTTVTVDYITLPGTLTAIEFAVQPISFTGGLIGFFATDTGSANAYVVTLSPVPTAYMTGLKIMFKATNTNTGASTLNVNGIGTKTIKKNVSTDLSAGDITANQYVEVIYDGTNFQLLNVAGGTSLTKGASSDVNTGTDDAKYLTALALRGSILLNLQNGLINGKIVTSVASNNLTVAIKTFAGNDPSASDPVFVEINGTLRTITAALSKTLNAGTDWFGSGGAKLAAKEVDYFVYVGYNSTDGVTMGFARIPYATRYSDFSTSSTNVRYCAISNITTAASSDAYRVVGRFNATLSASASYNWSIPATSIIINEPIYKTRILQWDILNGGSTLSGAGTLSVGTITVYNQDYQIDYTDLVIYPGLRGTISGTGNEIRIPLPITTINYDGNTKRTGAGVRIGDGSVMVGTYELLDSGQVTVRRYDNGNFGTGSGKEIYGQFRVPISL